MATIAGAPVDAWRTSRLQEIHADIQALVHDPGRTGSVREHIDRLWQTASVVRDRISIDSWKVLARVRRASLGGRSLPRPTSVRVADVLPHLDTLIF
ncbi:MAG: alpha-E domain-containing protein, partial [bacterium]